MSTFPHVAVRFGQRIGQADRAREPAFAHRVLNGDLAARIADGLLKGVAQGFAVRPQDKQPLLSCL